MRVQLFLEEQLELSEEAGARGELAGHEFDGFDLVFYCLVEVAEIAVHDPVDFFAAHGSGFDVVILQ